VINACGDLKALANSRLVHEQFIQSGFESNVFVGNSLVDMYAQCGNIEAAWQMLSKMSS